MIDKNEININNLTIIIKLLNSIINKEIETTKAYGSEFTQIIGLVQNLDKSFKFKKDLSNTIQSLGLIDTVEQFKFQINNIIRRLDKEIEEIKKLK